MKINHFYFFILAWLSFFIISSQLYANDQLFINSRLCCEGENVIFTVSVNDTPFIINSFGFEVQFDSSVLNYITFSRGNVTESMNIFNANFNASNESVIIGGLSYEDNKKIPPGSTGTIIELTFSVTDCQNRDLTLINLIDDMEGWSTHNGHLLCEDKKEDCILSINDQTCSGSGDISFSVSVGNTLIPIDALGFDVNFDSSSLAYKSFERGNLTENFNLFNVNLAPSGDSLIIGGLSYEHSGVIPPGSSGTIAQLIFTVINCKNSTLILANPIDNLEACITENGTLVQQETSSQPQTTPFTGGLWGATTSTTSPFTFSLSPQTLGGTFTPNLGANSSSLFGTTTTSSFGFTPLSPSSSLVSPFSTGLGTPNPFNSLW